MKPDGHRGVQAWLDEQIAETLYLTSISLSELLLGVEFLPDGKRKVGLAAALGEFLLILFGERVLPFDRRPPASTTIASRRLSHRSAVPAGLGDPARVASGLRVERLRVSAGPQCVAAD
jgi:predicted nucleic acid-binding protein